MPEMIKDGKGRGYLMQVDDENRAWVLAVTVDGIAHVSKEHGDAYIFGMFVNPMTLPDVDTWYFMGHLKNLSTSKRLVIRSFTISWNGGDTTGNSVLWIRTFAGYTGPTANYTTGTFGQMNRTSPNTAAGSLLSWDGVGNGMTATGGGGGDASAVAKGRSTINLYDATIFGLNDYSGLQVMSSEVGKFTLGGQGYFTENGV